MSKLFWLLTLLCSLISAAFAEDNPATFTLNTSGFLDNGILPVLYTCDGKDISPQFDWTDAPAKTQTFAIVLKDNQAPGGVFYHWVIYNLPKSTQSLDEGIQQLPAGAQMGKNSWNKAQYNGPCPPKNSTHTYVFTIYALDSKLSLPIGTEAAIIEAAMKNHIVGTASLTAVYSRWIT
jgi:Raf kinase inhibitor-like YbhB/YbcL family protein